MSVTILWGKNGKRYAVDERGNKIQIGTVMVKDDKKR